MYMLNWQLANGSGSRSPAGQWQHVLGLDFMVPKLFPRCFVYANLCRLGSATCFASVSKWTEDNLPRRPYTPLVAVSCVCMSISGWNRGQETAGGVTFLCSKTREIRATECNPPLIYLDVSNPRSYSCATGVLSNMYAHKGISSFPRCYLCVLSHFNDSPLSDGRCTTTSLHSRYSAFHQHDEVTHHSVGQNCQTCFWFSPHLLPPGSVSA